MAAGDCGDFRATPWRSTAPPSWSVAYGDGKVASLRTGSATCLRTSFDGGATDGQAAKLTAFDAALNRLLRLLRGDRRRHVVVVRGTVGSLRSKVPAVAR